MIDLRNSPTGRFLRFAACWVVGLIGMTSARGQDDPRGIAFFENKIRPVLIKHCYECHAQDSKSIKAGLLLDSRKATLKGGESGPAVVPRNVDESLLISALRFEDFEMPPSGKLSSSVIRDFETWIKMGAPDPRTHDSAAPAAKNATRDPAEHWSLQPIEKASLPKVADSDWTYGPIDTFVLARLEQQQIKPANDATAAELVRRLYVDLIGLPPTPEQLQLQISRLNLKQSGKLNQLAVGELVDALLDSPHFGERWGRHWLDLARYADSTGGGASSVFPDAWKYRNYVIRSFNKDIPYDRFIREQIAGDLFPTQDVDQRADNLVATGFLTLGPRNYITDDAVTFQMDGIDEQVDTIGRVFLGMTIRCSRCHDHKFDSISQNDYYAIAGILNSTQSATTVPASKNYTWNSESDPRVDPDGSLLTAYNGAYLRYRTHAKQVTLLKKSIASVQETGILPDNASENSIETWVKANEASLAKMQVRVAEIRKEVPPRPETFMAVRCSAEPTDMHLRLRGNPHKSGDIVKRGFPLVISAVMRDQPTEPTITPRESGRRELADWITSPANPLTTRVFVNRVWMHLLGRGLVTTVDNFGTTGTQPSHPHLLDFLASQFIDDGWSIKRLIRRIVLSRTYQLGVGTQAIDASVDPDNQLFGRKSVRSMDAETLRDSMLAVSGELDSSPGLQPFPPKLRSEFGYQDKSMRRSVYTTRFRNSPAELLQSFDVANPTLVVGKRDQTILPTQALFLINNDFVIDRSHAAAERLLASGDDSTESRVQRMYLQTLSRNPGANELDVARQFIDDNAGSLPPLELWTALQQTLFECVDFRFVR